VCTENVQAKVFWEGKCDNVDYQDDAGIYRAVCMHWKFWYTDYFSQGFLAYVMLYFA